MKLTANQIERYSTADETLTKMLNALLDVCNGVPATQACANHNVPVKQFLGLIEWANNPQTRVKPKTITISHSKMYMTPQERLYSVITGETDIANIPPYVNTEMDDILDRLCTDREKGIINERFYQNKTLEETGKIFRVTRERIRQQEKKVFDKIRNDSTAMNTLMFGSDAMIEFNEQRKQLYNDKWNEVIEERTQTCIEEAIEDAEKMVKIINNNPELKEDIIANEMNLTDIPIEELDPSVRAYNCLKRAGINTLDDLTRKTENELMHIRNLGRKCTDELKEKLAKCGLSLAESPTNSEDIYEKPKRKNRIRKSHETSEPYDELDVYKNTIPLDTPIDKTVLHNRTKECLEKANIKTVGDLTAVSNDMLFTICNFNGTYIDNIENFKKTYDLKFDSKLHSTKYPNETKLPTITANGTKLKLRTEYIYAFKFLYDNRIYDLDIFKNYTLYQIMSGIAGPITHTQLNNLLKLLENYKIEISRDIQSDVNASIATPIDQIKELTPYQKSELKKMNIYTLYDIRSTSIKDIWVKTQLAVSDIGHIGKILLKLGYDINNKPSLTPCPSGHIVTDITCRLLDATISLEFNGNNSFNRGVYFEATDKNFKDTILADENPDIFKLYIRTNGSDAEIVTMTREQRILISKYIAICSALTQKLRDGADLSTEADDYLDAVNEIYDTCDDCHICTQFETTVSTLSSL